MKILLLLIGQALSLRQLYKYHPNMHVLGNHGFGGKIHAYIAPIATKLIDKIAYDNKNIRKELINTYDNKSVLDLCCGVGVSTPEINKNILNKGIDISKEMVNVGNQLFKNKNLVLADSETYQDKYKYDIVNICFAFHEIPQKARKIIIKNAINNSKGKVCIMDICPTYNPSPSMLLGEPYIEDYLNSIENDLKVFKKNIIIPNSVVLWEYKIS